MNPGQLTVLRSTICVVLTMHFSVQVMSAHLLCWKKPKEQKAILHIVLMAPIYAVDSYVGLLDFWGSKSFFMFLESINESYEDLPKTARLNHHPLKLLKYWTRQFVVICHVFCFWQGIVLDILVALGVI